VVPYLILSATIFAVGAFGVVARRNLLIVLMSIELMFNGANIALVAFARRHADAGGHVFALATMAVAAAEVAVGLAILILLFRHRRTVDSAELRDLRG